MSNILTENISVRTIAIGLNGSKNCGSESSVNCFSLLMHPFEKCNSTSAHFIEVGNKNDNNNYNC